jgi:hypothetical protein
MELARARVCRSHHRVPLSNEAKYPAQIHDLKASVRCYGRMPVAIVSIRAASQRWRFRWWTSRGVLGVTNG